MDRLAQFIIAATDLLEAEMALLKENLYRLGSALVFLVVGALLLLGAAGFLLWAVFLGLQRWLSPGQAALGCTVAGLILGGICLWRAQRLASKG